MSAYDQRATLVLLASFSFVLIVSASSAGQVEKPASKPLTLEEAVDFALKNYPAVRAALARESAARAGISLARTTYLPRADALWQSNRATRNNIFGLLLPQSIVPPISGPVLPITSNRSVWGSAAGLLFSWEPFDFGTRRATVNAARATQNRASAEVGVTQLDVAVAATNAFLTLLAAQERARAAQADVDRRGVFAKSIHTLVDNQLRPGVDASRADAELAEARTNLFRAEQAEQESRAALATILGIAGTEVKIQAGPLVELPRESAVPASPLSKHPVARAQRARVDEVDARVGILDRSYYPRFNFQSAVSGRGSGADVNGSVASGANGLGLERYNWAAGMAVTFPLFDFASIHARKQIELANERAEAARYDQTIQDLTGQLERARAALEGARRVAQNTPVQLQAARATESQARTRYQAGLSTIVEVAEAQSLLVRAETDDALARLAVWLDLASLAAAQGDLEPFMQLLRKRAPGGP